MAIQKSRFDQLLEYWDPRVRSAFLQAVSHVADQAQISQITRLLEERNIEGAIRAVGFDPVFLRSLDQAISGTFEAAGNMAANLLPATITSEGYQTKFRFDIRNPVAERWLSEWAGTKIGGIVADQNNMIRETLVDNLSKGMNPRASALDIVGRIGPSGQREGGMLGLTSSQAEWVRSYRDDLLSDNPRDALSRSLRNRTYDAAVNRAANSGERLDPDLVDKMVDSYRNRALRLRAESIAQSETLTALHEAQQQSIEQAIEQGAIAPDAISFIWRTAGDDRVREIHAVMDGQVRALGEMFVDGEGNELEYPGDPNAPLETTINCRCWREPMVDFLAGIE